MTARLTTVEEIDGLYLVWNDHINASALHCRALREEMDVHGVDPNGLRKLLEWARHQGHTPEGTAENTNRFADLQPLMENRQDHPPTGDATDE